MALVNFRKLLLIDMGDLTVEEESYVTPKGLADRIAEKKAHEAEAFEAMYVELISQFLQDPWENSLGEKALEAINLRLSRVKASPSDLEDAFRYVIAKTNKFGDLTNIIPGQRFPNSYLNSLITNIRNAASNVPVEVREALADKYFLIFKAMIFNPAAKRLKDIIDFDNKIKIVKNKRFEWIKTRIAKAKATQEEIEELALHMKRLNGGTVNGGRQYSTRARSNDREG